MEQVDQGKFSCQECGKSYKWKPEFAGRKVKCKCGYVMTAPTNPPGSAKTDEPDLDALYSLADEGKQAAKAGRTEAPTLRCPSCQQNLEPGASMCAACGFNLKTGKKAVPKAAAGARAAGGGGGGGGAAVATLGAPGRGAGGAPSALAAYGAPRRGLQKDEPNDFKTVDLYLPIGLLVGGIALTVLQHMQFAQIVEPLQQALLYTGIKLVLSFILVAFVSIFLIKWMEMAFGDPALAALKIASVVLAPAAIAYIIGYLVHDAWLFLTFFLAFGMIFVAYHYLFEWDQGEKWVISGVTAGICIFVVPFALEALVHSGAGGGSLASKGTKNEDKQIDYMIDELGLPKPAKAWMADNPGRLVGDNARPDSAELIDGLYNLGATDIWIAAETKDPHAREIYIKLPSNAKKRKAIIDFFSQWNAKHGRPVITDNGGKYLIQTFLPFSRPEPISAF